MTEPMVGIQLIFIVRLLETCSTNFWWVSKLKFVGMNLKVKSNTIRNIYENLLISKTKNII